MRPRRSLLIVAALLVTGAATGIGVALRHPLRQLEHTTIDWRYQLRGTGTRPDGVVLVAIDDRTVSRLNRRLPPSRLIQARVVRNLTRAGARVIAYDLTLSGITTPDGDLAIVRALNHARGAVVSVLPASARGTPDVVAGIRRFADTRIRPGNTLRYGELAGTWIRVRPRVDGIDSFPAAAAAAYRGRKQIAVPAGALIDYRGPAGSVPTVSFGDVLDGRFSPAAVRGRVAVVGDTAPPDVVDLHDVPIGRKMTGAEVHANAIATALDGFPLRTVSAGTTALVTLGLAALESLVLLVLVGERARRHRPPPSPLVIAAIGAVVASLWAVGVQLAFDGGSVLEFMPGGVAILLTTGLTWVAASVFERRSYLALRRRFAAGDRDFVAEVISTPPDDPGLGRLRSIVTGYTLDGMLGSGGMGIVYRAREEALDRPVALKVIRDDLRQDARYRQRFLEEATRAAAVEHPNVVPIYSMGDEGEVLFIVMRLIDGPDLGRRLREQGVLGLGEAARLLHRVATGLDALSDRGIVHCDVKPSNILCATADPDHPYLTDFGIARSRGAQQGGGTAEYVAPEQIQGAPVDARTDVYSLGAVLFESVTGTVPFEMDDTDELLYAQATAERPRASDRNPALPAKLDWLIQRAMAREPEERFATATAFMRAVLDLLKDERDGSNGGGRPEADGPKRTSPLD
jgi:CHASE2 domain-containing sensor protein/tRNA A-37 threonylcarbamoyl transferase component Bud32